ncbi:internal scaffolding protein [Microviridae sp.]|nr:internal scaffolding protein [Microviridae sp.]
MKKSTINIPELQNTVTLNPRKRVQISFTKPTLTKQSFKQECDINYIVKKFQTTGQLPISNTLEPQFGNAPTIDLKESLDLVKNLHREFDELPAKIKAVFGNDPSNYGQFLSDYEELPESLSMDSSPDPDTSVQKNQSDAVKVDSRSDSGDE